MASHTSFDYNTTVYGHTLYITTCQYKATHTICFHKTSLLDESTTKGTWCTMFDDT